MLFIVDIDGTIADITHRLHYLDTLKPNGGAYLPATESAEVWKAFHAASVDDKPIWEVITVVRALHAAGQSIVYSTGRSDDNRAITQDWLRKWRLPSGRGLYMRKYGDHREDNVIKSDLLDQIIDDWVDPDVMPIGGIFEDRQQVVDMYRARGIKVFQVAKGDY